LDEQKCTKCGISKPLSSEFFGYRKERAKFRKDCNVCRRKRRNDYKHIEGRFKICKDCNTLHEATPENFFRNKDSRDGLLNKCKKCSLKAADPEAYKRRDKEKKNEIQKRYRRKHKNKINQKHKEYKTLNKEKLKKKNVIYSQRRRASERFTYSDFSYEQWMDCKDSFNNECAYCGEKKELTQDHFIPLSKGGEYTINNIVPSCRSCNCSKSDSDFFTWYPQSGRYCSKREKELLKYLNYHNKEQQLSIL
jgi:hypothetical protein